jgi:hypothetical protein
MDVGSGDVMIRTGDRTRASVTAQVRTWWWRDGDPAYRRDGDSIVLTGCRGCSVDYELVVRAAPPSPGTAGRAPCSCRGCVRSTSSWAPGDIRVREVSGAVGARTGSGEVTLVHVAGPVDVQSSSGSISGSGLSGPVVADTSSGDVVLKLTRAQEVRASTSSGDVDLTVPAGRYRVDTGDDEGADIEVVDDPDARYALELDTSSGDIAVRTR